MARQDSTSGILARALLFTDVEMSFALKATRNEMKQSFDFKSLFDGIDGLLC
jgi:hypothetical protein